MNIPKASDAKKPGFKVLMIGGTGTGKTYSVASLAAMGMNVRYLFTENGMSTLDALPAALKGFVGNKIHYAYRPAVETSIEMLLNAAKLVNTMSYENLTKMLPTDRNKTQEFIHILGSLMNFKSDLTGEEFGSVLNWGPEDCLVIDSLSGINLAVMRNLMGTKPVAGQQDWQVAMRQEEELLNMLCLNARCSVVVIAHPERELDEITGAQFVYAGALGRKLGPKIGRFFDEIIEAKRKGEVFTWSNASDSADTKRRLLPFGDKLKPDWTPLVNSIMGGK